MEYLRATGSPVHLHLKQLIADEVALATTEVVIMEVLAGARDEARARRLRRMLLRCEVVPARGLVDYEAAAELYRRCRRQGVTIRRLPDCLIAAIAIRRDLSVMHHDADFDRLARHAPLLIASLPGTREDD